MLKKHDAFRKKTVLQDTSEKKKRVEFLLAKQSI